MANLNQPAQLEEGAELQLDFAKLLAIAGGGVEIIPAVLQDRDTHMVLMVAYMDREALDLSLSEGRVVLWSTTRQERWRKGESSGDELALHEVRVNCEQNSLLCIVSKRNGGVCHTLGTNRRTRPSCFYRRVGSTGQLVPLATVTELD